MTNALACRGGRGVYDAELPTLARVLDPLSLSARLEPVLRGKHSAVQQLEVCVIQHHPGRRCTVGISAHRDGVALELIGKVYARDRRDIFEAMVRVEQAGFVRGRAYAIPRPLAFVPSLTLLVQERVNGRTVKELFLSEERQTRTTGARRGAAWLRRFQAECPPSGRVSDDATMLRAIGRWAGYVSELGPPFSLKAAVLRGRLTRLASIVQPPELCAGHGSFSPAHVAVNAEGTAVFDWDGYDTADRYRDAARFVIATQRLALGRKGSLNALDDAVQWFEEDFLRGTAPSARARFQFMKAVMCLRLARYGLQHPVPSWREKTLALLDHGVSLTEAGGG